MNNFFDIRRFWNVLKHDFFVVWTIPVIALVLPAIICGVFASFDEQYYYVLQGWIGFAALLSVVLLFILSRYTYKNFLAKKQSLNTLVLPASLFEKMLSRLIYCWFLPLLIYILHCWLYWQLPAVEYFHESTSPNTMKILFGVSIFAVEMSVISMIFWGTIFKRFASLITLVVVAVLLYILGKFESYINMLWFDRIIRYIYAEENNFIIFESIVFVIFGLFNFCLSYLILSKKQIR